MFCYNVITFNCFNVCYIIKIEKNRVTITLKWFGTLCVYKTPHIYVHKHYNRKCPLCYKLLYRDEKCLFEMKIILSNLLYQHEIYASFRLNHGHSHSCHTLTFCFTFIFTHTHTHIYNSSSSNKSLSMH